MPLVSVRERSERQWAGTWHGGHLHAPVAGAVFVAVVAGNRMVFAEASREQRVVGHAGLDQRAHHRERALGRQLPVVAIGARAPPRIGRSSVKPLTISDFVARRKVGRRAGAAISGSSARPLPRSSAELRSNSTLPRMPMRPSTKVISPARSGPGQGALQHASGAPWRLALAALGLEVVGHADLEADDPHEEQHEDARAGRPSGRRRRPTRAGRSAALPQADTSCSPLRGATGERALRRFRSCSNSSRWNCSWRANTSWVEASWSPSASAAAPRPGALHGRPRARRGSRSRPGRPRAGAPRSWWNSSATAPISTLEARSTVAASCTRPVVVSRPLLRRSAWPVSSPASDWVCWAWRACSSVSELARSALACSSPSASRAVAWSFAESHSAAPASARARLGMLSSCAARCAWSRPACASLASASRARLLGAASLSRAAWPALRQQLRSWRVAGARRELAWAAAPGDSSCLHCAQPALNCLFLLRRQGGQPLAPRPQRR